MKNETELNTVVEGLIVDYRNRIISLFAQIFAFSRYCRPSDLMK
jgi:hypothetical protein